MPTPKQIATNAIQRINELVLPRMEQSRAVGLLVLTAHPTDDTDLNPDSEIETAEYYAGNTYLATGALLSAMQSLCERVRGTPDAVHLERDLHNCISILNSKDN